MKYDITPLSCRVCLEIPNKKRSVHKVVEEGDETPNEMLQQITGTLFDEADYDETVPKNICKSCELALNLAYQFRLKAINSLKIVQKYCNYKPKLSEKYTENRYKTIVKYEDDTHYYVEMEPNEDTRIDNILKNHNGEQIDSLSNEVIEYEIVSEEFVENNNMKLEEVELYMEDNEEVQILSDDESNSLHMDYQSDEEINIQTDDCLNFQMDEGSNLQIDEGSNSQNEECEESEEECEDKKENMQSYELKKIKKEKKNLSTTSLNDEEEVNNEPIKKSKRHHHNTRNVKSEEMQSNNKGVKRGRKIKLLGTEGHICDICGNTYAKRGRLMEHRRLHNKELKYFCELCPVGFYQREMLRKHMFIHKGGKPFKCSYCSRTFFYESVKKAHEDVHKGHKPYVCEVCNKAFAYGHTLKKHELIHADIKLYHCKYCDKDFRLQHHMKQHEETKLHQNAVAHANL